MTEEDFETTEGEAQDLYDKLMELGGWTPTVPETLRKRMTCLDSYWSIIVYMTVVCNENSCFDKFFKFKFISEKIGNPIPDPCTVNTYS